MNILSGYHYFTLRLFQTDRILFCELKIIALVRALQGVVCTALRRPTKKNSPNFSHTQVQCTLLLRQHWVWIPGRNRFYRRLQVQVLSKLLI